MEEPVGVSSVIIHWEPGGQRQGCVAHTEHVMLHMIIHATD